jgi:nitrogen fixation/metabolism regulation signal transduction histidine kinase
MTNKIALREITNQLIKEILPSAISRNSFIINDIPADTKLYADKTVIAHILGNLLSNTVGSSHHGCIRVSAKDEDGHVTISVKDNNNDYSRFISGKMEKVKPSVMKMGGDLNFEFNQRNSITILVSFANNNVAA